MTLPVVGLDLGGTTLKAACFDEAFEVVRSAKAPTPTDDPSGTVTAERLAGLVAEVAGGQPAVVGLAVPGIIDEARGVVERSVNLGWAEVPIRDLVADRVTSLVAFGHDVRLGGLAEFERGAAESVPDAMFVPIGTGISFAARVDGRMISAGGWAGEIGMRRIDGVRLEELASASGLARRLGVADGEAVAALVDAKDPAAESAWRDAIEALSDGLAWSAAALGTRVIVLGGGLSRSGETLLGPLRAAMRTRLDDERMPELRVAAFGPWAACYGAATLARRAR